YLPKRCILHVCADGSSPLKYGLNLTVPVSECICRCCDVLPLRELPLRAYPVGLTLKIGNAFLDKPLHTYLIIGQNPPRLLSAYRLLYRNPFSIRHRTTNTNLHFDPKE